jgi:hypothetical protein
MKLGSGNAGFEIRGPTERLSRSELDLYPMPIYLPSEATVAPAVRLAILTVSCLCPL